MGRRLRWSGAAFGAGAVTLAGLPPTIGFVSEWFILEALMQQFRLPGLAIRLGLAAAGALVALTTGLAALAFLRVLGLTFLGRPDARGRRRGPRHRDRSARPGLSPSGFGCLGLAAVTPWEIRYIARGLSIPSSPDTPRIQALKSPWVLQPVFHGFSILSPSWLWVAMPTAFLGVFLGAIVLSGGRYLRVRRVPAWHSATSGVSGPVVLLRLSDSPTRCATSSATSWGPAARPRSSCQSPRMTTARHPVAHVETRTRVVEPVETYLYRPVRDGRTSAWPG